MKDSKESIGHRIRRLRKSQGLTVKKCAQAIGVAPSTFREWEMERAIQGEPYLALAQLFEVTLGELMVGKTISDRDSLLQLVSEAEMALKSLKKALLSLL